MDKYIRYVLDVEGKIISYLFWQHREEVSIIIKKEVMSSNV